MLTTNQFVEKANQVHSFKYDYSQVKYINSKTKVKIVCLEHGEFNQSPSNHLNGQGCKECYLKNKPYSQSIFIEKAKKIHGNKYDYSKVEYINGRTKVKIICPEHGEFEQRPANHIVGAGCPKCHPLKQPLTIEQFIEKSNIIHNFKYDYSKSIYINSSIKIEIICNKHGAFLQTPQNHLSGAGCPKCNQSKGELKIKEWLDKNKIKYESQKKFNDCINPQTNRILPFDFYLTDFNICIEYDGEQHFKPTFPKYNLEKAKINLEKQKYFDHLKNQYCIKNNIKIIRIPYSRFRNIEKVLDNEFNDIISAW